MGRDNLLYLLKVLGLVLVMSYVVDKIIFLAFNQISDKVYTGQSIGKLNQFLKLKDSLDWIVLGSSRANHTIDPSQLTPRSYNMGLDGRQIAYSAALIKLLPTQKDQTILLQVDPLSAVSPAYDGSDLKALNTKYNRNETIRTEINRMGQDNRFQLFFWSLSYNGMVMGILKNYLRPGYDHHTYLGYDPIYPTDQQQKIFQTILNRKKEVPCGSPTINPIYQKTLEELAIYCKNHRKKLIVFSSPEYADRCKDDDVLLDNLMQNLGIKYYNMTDFFKRNNDLKNWKDETHLSHKGASQFTIAFRKKLGLP
ncbi:MAG TPA: hypothetical protein PKA12_15105 [Saprospiraceae bacterium]|nr:hypothetical protein [Saprospiraceae bacterium]